VNKKLIIVSFLIVLALAITFTGCKKEEEKIEATPSPTETATTVSNLATTNLTNVNPTTIDTIVTQNYNLAKVKAQEWKEDAVLVSIAIKLPYDLAVNASNDTFIFGSASDSANWWSFSISEKDSRYIRAIIPKEDYLGTNVQPVNMSYWKMNYGQAFQLAEANGGQAFRNVNPNTTVTATLHHTQPRNWLWWEIEYKSSTNKLVIKVNPNDGQVIDENGNPLSAGGSITTNTTTTTTPTVTPQTMPNTNY